MVVFPELFLPKMKLVGAISIGPVSAKARRLIRRMPRMACGTARLLGATSATKVVTSKETVRLCGVNVAEQVLAALAESTRSEGCLVDQLIM